MRAVLFWFWEGNCGQGEGLWVKAHVKKVGMLCDAKSALLFHAVERFEGCRVHHFYHENTVLTNGRVGLSSLEVFLSVFVMIHVRNLRLLRGARG